jgi:Fur family ferric uptake transcriptional regulator
MSDSRHGGGQVRVTRQRRAVSSALDDTDGFRSAQQIHELLRSRGDKVGLTTVYRTLQAMAEADEVDVLRADDGEALYRQCSSGGHHHHLVCRSCGLTAEVEGPTVENWADRVAAVHGFSDVSHTLEIFGLCGGCSRTYE